MRLTERPVAGQVGARPRAVGPRRPPHRRALGDAAVAEQGHRPDDEHAGPVGGGTPGRDQRRRAAGQRRCRPTRPAPSARPAGATGRCRARRPRSPTSRRSPGRSGSARATPGHRRPSRRRSRTAAAARAPPGRRRARCSTGCWSAPRPARPRPGRPLAPRGAATSHFAWNAVGDTGVTATSREPPPGLEHGQPRPRGRALRSARPDEQVVAPRRDHHRLVARGSATSAVTRAVATRPRAGPGPTPTGPSHARRQQQHRDERHPPPAADRAPPDRSGPHTSIVRPTGPCRPGRPALATARPRAAARCSRRPWATARSIHQATQPHGDRDHPAAVGDQRRGVLDAAAQLVGHGHEVVRRRAAPEPHLAAELQVHRLRIGAAADRNGSAEGALVAGHLGVLGLLVDRAGRRRALLGRRARLDLVRELGRVVLAEPAQREVRDHRGEQGGPERRGRAAGRGRAGRRSQSRLTQPRKTSRRSRL